MRAAVVEEWARAVSVCLFCGRGADVCVECWRWWRVGMLKAVLGMCGVVGGGRAVFFVRDAAAGGSVGFEVGDAWSAFGGWQVVDLGRHFYGGDVVQCPAFGSGKRQVAFD